MIDFNCDQTGEEEEKENEQEKEVDLHLLLDQSKFQASLPFF